ncbi:MAG: hypothetical protein U5N86_07845 [Planctomycetota bacterium]|nr:hypothetical protein [Planctomycetota bacterium]
MINTEFTRCFYLGALLVLLPVFTASCAEHNEGKGMTRRVVYEQTIEIGVGQKRVFSGIDELIFSEPCKIAASGGALEIRGTLSRPLVVSFQKLSFDLSESALLIFEHVVFRMSGEYAKFPRFIHARGSSVLVRHCEFSCLQYYVFLETLDCATSVEDIYFKDCSFSFCFSGPVRTGFAIVKDAVFEESCVCYDQVANGNLVVDGLQYKHPENEGYVEVEVTMLQNCRLNGKITVSASRIERSFLKVSDVKLFGLVLPAVVSVLETEVWLSLSYWPDLLQKNTAHYGGFLRNCTIYLDITDSPSFLGPFTTHLQRRDLSKLRDVLQSGCKVYIKEIPDKPTTYRRHDLFEEAAIYLIEAQDGYFRLTLDPSASEENE